MKPGTVAGTFPEEPCLPLPAGTAQIDSSLPKRLQTYLGKRTVAKKTALKLVPVSMCTIPPGF